MYTITSGIDDTKAQKLAMEAILAFADECYQYGYFWFTVDAMIRHGGELSLIQSRPYTMRLMAERGLLVGIFARRDSDGKRVQLWCIANKSRPQYNERTIPDEHVLE